MRPKIIVVTDPAYPDEALVRAIDAAASALAPGALGVQLRDKTRDIVSLRVLASRLRVLTRARGALLFINGDARLARDVGADGVHLGGGAGSIAEARAICGARAWVSIAAHGDAAVRAAAREGADAALVSPIFPTTSGGGGKRPRGVGALASARAVAGGVALYALGGVDATNARACVAAGADGVAVIRALLGSDDPADTARALAAAVDAR